MSTVGTRCTRWVTLALVAWAGLLLDASPSWAISPTLYLEPIPGLTSQRYDVPDELTVPIGTVLRFRQTFFSPAAWVEVVWTGAVEESREATASVAVFALDRVGVQVVTSTVKVHGRVKASFTCRLNVVDVTVEQIQIRPLRIPEAQLRLTEYATNEETMAAFFGDSIAALRPVADRRDFRAGRRFSKSADVPPCYVTSVGRAIELGVDVTPSALASLMEWRIDGQPPRLGGSTTVTFQQPGRHVISVGPFRNEQRIEIETYRVSIVSHASGDDIVREGEAITFEAVTDPPGYEDHITWLSSTKYGTATPVLGYGPTFTAWFDDTWGAHDATGEPFQWLGVKADNAVFNQDQKPSPTFYQLDLDLDDGQAIDSDWGAVDLTYVGRSAVQYFNLSVNGTWQVQNVPALSHKGDGVIQTETFHFSLGVAIGTQVSTINAGFSLSLLPLSSAPVSTGTHLVLDRTHLLKQGEVGGGVAYSPAQNLIGVAAPVQVAIWSFNFGMPNQESGVCECVPVAASNSLQFLNNNHGLGINCQDISIANMKTATRWNQVIANKVPSTWPDDKNTHLNNNNLPVSTTFNPTMGQTVKQRKAVLAAAIEGVKDNKNVELRGLVHTATIVGIADLGGCRYSIKVSHDTRQGVDGGTTCETITYDANTNVTSGGTWFNNRELRGIVFECPTKDVDDPPMGPCCIGGVCSIKSLQDCLLMNGNYLGTGRTCSATACTDAAAQMHCEYDVVALAISGPAHPNGECAMCPFDVSDTVEMWHLPCGGTKPCPPRHFIQFPCNGGGICGVSFANPACQ